MFKLADTYEATGNTLEGFKEEIETLTKATRTMVVSNDDIILLSHLKTNPEKGLEYFRKLGPVSLLKTEQGGNYEFAAAPIKTFDEDLLSEMKENTGLVLNYGKSAYYVGKSAIATLGLRVGVKGDLLAEKSIFRDAYLAHGLSTTIGQTTLIIREEKKEIDGKERTFGKVFACMSGKYNYIPMTLLPDAISIVAEKNILGNAEVRYWNTDHYFTEIYIEFPEAADDFKEAYDLSDRVIPGIMLCSSDTGDSSVIIRGTYRREKSSGYVTTEEFRVKHSSKIDSEKILEIVNDDILENVRHLPESLAILMGRPVADPSLDLTNEKDCRKNYEAVEDALKTGMKRLKLASILGAKRTKELLNCMYDEINSTVPYTEYDIAMNFFTLTDRVEGLCQSTKDELAKLCGKAPFITYTEDKAAVMPIVLAS